MVTARLEWKTRSFKGPSRGDGFATAKGSFQKLDR